MNTIKNILLSDTNKDLLISFELEFIDPNNPSMGWFNDYYVETATFEEIYNRYILHPNAIKEISHEKWSKLFAFNRNDCLSQMCNSLNGADNEHFAIEEIANEIEHISGIKIGLLLLDCTKPEPDDENWALGIDNKIVLRSPFMSVKDSIVSINSVIKGLDSRHFLSGGGAFRIYVKNIHHSIQDFNWFKIMVLYDRDATIEYLKNVPISKRKKYTREIYNRVPEQDVRLLLERILSNIKATTFKYYKDFGIFELSDNERYIPDRENMIKWISRILLISVVATDTEQQREEYIKQLRYVLTKVGIQK